MNLYADHHLNFQVIGLSRDDVPRAVSAGSHHPGSYTASRRPPKTKLNLTCRRPRGCCPFSTASRNPSAANPAGSRSNNWLGEIARRAGIRRPHPASSRSNNCARRKEAPLEEGNRIWVVTPTARAAGRAVPPNPSSRLHAPVCAMPWAPSVVAGQIAPKRRFWTKASLCEHNCTPSGNDGDKMHPAAPFNCCGFGSNRCSGQSRGGGIDRACRASHRLQ